MSLSYDALIRICSYMTANSYDRATKLGPSVKPESSGIAKVYQSQLIGTCLEDDGKNLRREFYPDVPSASTFRIVVDRLVANALVLDDERNVDNICGSSDDGQLGDYVYLLSKFEVLRAKKTEDVPQGEIPGLGLTDKALRDAAALMQKQPIFYTWSIDRILRRLKLEFIRELVTVADVFRRPPRSAADRTWQQVQEDLRRSMAEESKAEEDAINASTAGKGSKSKKRSAEVPAEDPDEDYDDEPPSKYKSASQIRKEMQKNKPTIPSGDPLTDGLAQVTGFLSHRQAMDEAKMKKEAFDDLANSAFKIVVQNKNYKNNAEKWTTLLDEWGVHSTEDMTTVCTMVDAEFQAQFKALVNDLKIVPAATVNKFCASLTVNEA